MGPTRCRVAPAAWLRDRAGGRGVAPVGVPTAPSGPLLPARAGAMDGASGHPVVPNSTFSTFPCLQSTFYFIAKLN